MFNFKKFTKRTSRIVASLVLMTAQMMPFFAFSGVAKADDNNNNNVQICHASNSATSPYQSLSVSTNSINGVGSGDHYSDHTGPIATTVAVAQSLKDAHQTWGDIIPPLPGVHTGLNWTTVGQAIYNAGCSIATVKVVKKTVPTNDNGKFNLSIGNTVYATDVSNNGTTGEVYVNHQQAVTVSETAGTGTSLTNYTTTAVCKNGNGNGSTVGTPSVNGTTSRSDAISNNQISDGDQIVCTFTNTRLSGTLVVNKVIVNQWGGLDTADDFSFAINGSASTAFEADGSNSVQVNAGTYSVVESAAPGYTTTYNGCSQVSIANGQTKTCTITNTAQPATLTVNKIVNNDNGGTLSPNDFSFDVNGSGDYVFNESTATNGSYQLTLPRGTYSVAENSVHGYTPSYSGSCTNVVLELGQNATCTITNDDQPATLTIIKNLIKNNGSTANYSDFSFSVNGGVATQFDISGTNTKTVNAGTYSVEESLAQGYTTTYDNCSQVTLGVGDQATCTITNDDQPGYVTIVKTVVNEYNGPYDVKDFVLYVTKGDTSTYVKSGVATMLDAGNYVAGEDNLAGYTPSAWSGDCDEDGNLVVNLGEEYTCNITNTAQPAILHVHKMVINDNGGTKNTSDFKFNVNDQTGFGFDNDGSEDTTTLLLPAGDYTVVEDGSTAFGYQVSYSDCDEITALNGQEYDCYIRNDDIAPVVTVYKNANPCHDFEFMIVNNEEEVDYFQLGGCDSAYSYQTNSDYFQAGTVEVSEELPEGWVQDEAYCFNTTNEIGYEGTSFTAEIGKHYECYFTNTEEASVVVTKFHDYDEDGQWDKGEPALPNWDMTLTPADECNMLDRKVVLLDECIAPESRTETTNVEGDAVFEGVYPGSYTVNEILQKGWVQSNIYCDNDYEYDYDEYDYEETRLIASNQVYVRAGRMVYCYVGNYREPKVEIVKSNNITGAASRGTEITFTITVKVPTVANSGALKGAMSGMTYLPVTVTDNLQNEFSYVAGSFTAMSSVRGNLKTAGITVDPNYHSPGKWILTSLASNIMVPGEVVTLTYKAIVGANTPAGTYPTQATVVGYGDIVTVVATATDPDEVKVIVPAVLGASTTTTPVKLATTGSGQYLPVITGMLTILIALGLRRKTNE